MSLLLKKIVLKRVNYKLISKGNELRETSDEIFEWDSQNRLLNVESLELTVTSRMYLLELYFMEENASYNYEIEIKTPEDIKRYFNLNNFPSEYSCSILSIALSTPSRHFNKSIISLKILLIGHNYNKISA